MLLLIPLTLPVFAENHIQSQIIRSDDETIISYIVIPKDQSDNNATNGDVMLTSATMLSILSIGTFAVPAFIIKSWTRTQFYNMIPLWIALMAFTSMHLYIILESFTNSLSIEIYRISVIMTAIIIIFVGIMMMKLFRDEMRTLDLKHQTDADIIRANQGL